MIDVNGRGYIHDQGPGTGVKSGSHGGGAGHGGNGGSGDGAGGMTYDSITDPTQIGSGGGNSYNYNVSGGPGGGGVKLNIGARLTNDGIIRANGNNGSINSYGRSGGGGSGGFINITANELTGTGSITANGGNGGHTSSGGGGAGGRISIYCNTNNYVGAKSAHGGAGKQYGAAGSIYFKSNTSGEDQVIFDNNAHAGASTNISGILPDVMILNQAVVVAVDELTMADLTIDNACFYDNHETCAENVTISANGELRHSSNSSSQNYIIDMSVSGDMTIESEGFINVNGRGYIHDQGPGTGVKSGSHGGGAGHGGNGGSGDGAGGTTYDSITDPTQIGSGGGNSYNYNVSGGPGGGGIKLNIGGRLTNDGIIRANGNNGSINSYGRSGGGGSGGFINITTGELTGTGSITANGGNAGSTSAAGGGAGGRIAISYNTHNYTGATSTYGGLGKQRGAAGSIYFQSNTSIEGQVIFDNNGNSGASTYFSGILPDVMILNQAVVVAVDELTMADLTIDNACFYDNHETCAENVTISASGELRHSSNSSSQNYIIDVSVSGNMTIESGGFINVNGRGYIHDQGPGKGVKAGSHGGGAGHGGNGGSGDGAGGTTYGSIMDPTQIGSGGGNSYNYNVSGGPGGGGIKLNIEGRLTNDGIIRANGNNGSINSYGRSGGGGSGGFINITVGELTGTGSITANGGNGGSTSSAGGGGGGRIAIYYTGQRPTTTYNIANITTTGGIGKNNGQAGTLYIPEVGNPVITTNNGRDFTANIAAMSLEGTCLSDADLILINGSAGGVDHTSGDLSWSYSVTLAEGINTFEVIAQNALGNQSGAARIEIILDTTPAGAPAITTNTGGDFTVRISHVMLQGTCSADAVEILVNGSSDGVSFTPGTTAWTYEGELAIGENHFSVVAVDAASNISPADTITVIFENMLPDQPLNQSPADGETSVISQPTLTAGAFSDADSDTHISSHWQIRESSGAYSNPIYDSGEVSSDLNQITISEETLNWLTTYYWHVRYRDSRGSWSLYSSETSFTTIADNIPPEDITNFLIGERLFASIALSWDHSANSAGDLAGYAIYIDGQPESIQVDAAINSCTISDLTPGTTYQFRITAVDASGNESAGVQVSASTITENPGDVMGEVGQINDLNHNEKTVYFNYRYQNPVVIAQPPSYNSGDKCVVRITSVQADRFTLKIHEVPGTSDGGNHADETVSYLVIESGAWEMPEGGLLKAGTIVTDVTVGTRFNTSVWQNIGFNAPSFEFPPVVFTQVQTDNDPYWVKTREQNVTRTGFDAALEEEENRTTPHGAPETIGWIAADAGAGVWNSFPYISDKTANAVSHDWYTIPFGAFSTIPSFLASSMTYNGADSMALRYQNLTGTNVQIKIEEDTTYDSETSHDPEVAGYLAIQGSGPLTAQPYADANPPILISSEPADGASLQSVTQVVIHLYDQTGMDNQSVLTSFALTDSGGIPIPGDMTVLDSTFTFTLSVTLSDDTYAVTFTATDTLGNTADHTLTFRVDASPPVPPAITGGTVYSGLIAPQPVMNLANSTLVTLTGTREDGTAVWINNIEYVENGAGAWTVPLSLAEGMNTLTIFLKDSAGNSSDPVTVDIKVDTVAPAPGTVTPADNTYINTPPASFIQNFTETNSGLDLANTTKTVENGDGEDVAGTWQMAGGNQLVFTPTAIFEDSTFTVNIRLEDSAGNQSSAKAYHFTVDTQAPPAPVIDPMTSPANNPSQIISGTREAYARILLNETEVAGNTPQTTWQCTVNLASGLNLFTFAAIDRAGNRSADVSAEIVYDDIAPQKVNTLQADGAGSGTRVALDWTGYNEFLHGDIDYYRIYWSDAVFDSVTGLDVRGTVDKGHFIHTAAGLTKGTPYWFAVVAVDKAGNSDSSVAGVTVQAVPTDVVAPENITNLQAISYEDRLVFNWIHSANSSGDLAGYKIYFNGAAEGTTLPADQNTYEKTGLSPATAYTIRITSLDGETPPNESAGTSKTGATFLANPVVQPPQPFDGYIKLMWANSAPLNLVDHYNVYKSTTQFSSVEGMTPVRTTTGTSATISGLTNNTEYFFAVTSVNISGGEQKSVTTVSSTPVADTIGPVISNILFEGSPLTDGQTLAASGTITLSASDVAGVSSVAFMLDGSLLRTDYSAPYTCYIDTLALPDGSHTLVITAYDSLNNSTVRTFTINIALSVPPAPVITSPQTGLITNRADLTVKGTAQKNSIVSLYNQDGTALGVSTTADASGNFTANITLADGINTIKAAAANRSGEGPFSSTVTITLDTTIPQAPSNLSAQSRENGQIRLTWQKPADTNITGYNVYRSLASFTEAAAPINTSPVTGTAYTDLPSADALYYYRVTAINVPGNESALSEEVSAFSDSIGPAATQITYQPQGIQDPATGTMAPGRVDVMLYVSEPLMTTPFLSITPESGIPMSIPLTKISDTEYSGYFTISDTTPSGTAWAVFSARDLAGNRGTQVNQGESILIDAKGPEITRIAIAPADPVKTSQADPVAIQALFGLDEAVKTGDTPEISWLLSGNGRLEAALDNLIEVAPQAGDVQTWQGEFTLPSDAGLDAAETLSFIYTGRDYLDNVCDEISCKNAFQIYQGELPPLEAPFGLTGKSLPGGGVYLSWGAVEFAAGYQLFRQGPGESGMTAHGDPLSSSTLEFTDAPESDGLYFYAVASIREENGQASLSGLSETVAVKSDSTPPAPPVNLTLALASNGIYAGWESPGYAEPVTYALYRSSNATITTVEGLTPIVQKIPSHITEALDPHPSPIHHCYAVTATDEAGNQSGPSDDVYLNFGLLPVANLTVVQEDNAAPVISWTHPSAASISGYDLYYGFGTTNTKLNSGLLTQTTYTDIGYADDERAYTIVAVDSAGQSSMPRSIGLPLISAVFSEGASLKRGIMNRLDYDVTSQSSSSINGIQLNVNIASKNHVSDKFSLEPGDTKTVGVVIGGYADLPDLADLSTTLEISPNSGESVKIKRSGQIPVSDGMLGLRIVNEEFTRGGTGPVRFVLENTCDQEIEIVTAKNSGTRDSDIVWYLLDADGNILYAKNFRQSYGADVLTVSNGNTVARIPAGGAFSSDVLDLHVPASAPGNLTVRIAIPNIYYHRAKTDQVAMQGMSLQQPILLIDTSYSGEITSITPQSSTGDQDVVITGRAVERSSGNPLANVPLRLIITLKGIERSFNVIADQTGEFTHNFTPRPGESGLFKVCAIHPELLDRPVQGSFVISKVSLQYTSLKLAIPFNYEYHYSFNVTAGAATEVNNLRLVYEAADQPGGVYPPGIHLTPGPAVAHLSGGSSAKLSFTMWADNQAPAASSFAVKVVSDENEIPGWGKLTVNAAFSDPKPALYFTPNYIETGMARMDSVTENITLENKGLASMKDVSLALATQDGSPMPSWVYLITPAGISTIDAGEKKQVGVAFSPPESVAEGIYSFYLRLTSSNYKTVNINVFCSVTQSGIGSALFKLSDIYTGTINKNNDVVQGLSGAKIRVQNQQVVSVDHTLTTDHLGEALFADLPAGIYKYRAQASNHQEKTGQFWIKPGITVAEEVFLEYNLVTVEWEVTETTIQDRYDIILRATFETDVPAPVVVASPTSVTLPGMKAGDVLNGEFTLTNHGWSGQTVWWSYSRETISISNTKH